MSDEPQKAPPALYAPRCGNQTFAVTPRDLEVSGLIVSGGVYTSVDPKLTQINHVEYLSATTSSPHEVYHLAIGSDTTETNGTNVAELIAHLSEHRYRPADHRDLLGHGATRQMPLEYPLIALGSILFLEGDETGYAMVITPYNVSGAEKLGRSIGLVPCEPAGGKGWIPWWRFLTTSL